MAKLNFGVRFSKHDNPMRMLFVPEKLKGESKIMGEDTICVFFRMPFPDEDVGVRECPFPRSLVKDTDLF